MAKAILREFVVLERSCFEDKTCKSLQGALENSLLDMAAGNPDCSSALSKEQRQHLGSCSSCQDFMSGALESLAEMSPESVGYVRTFAEQLVMPPVYVAGSCEPAVSQSGNSTDPSVTGEWPTAFAELLENKRQASGHSKKDFAEFLEISQASLYSYLRGTQVPLSKRFETICNRLEVFGEQRSELFEQLKPKSLSLTEESLLSELISQRRTLDEIVESFSSCGFNRTSSVLAYHRSKLKEAIGLGPKSFLSENQDPQSELISIILREDAKSQKAKSIVSDRLAYGCVFQEFARLVINFGFRVPSGIIPEYALTVAKNGDGSEVIHTSNIIDVVAWHQAFEIKLGKSDPNTIARQVREQKAAILRLQENEAAHNPFVQKIKELRVLVLEECAATDKLRECYAGLSPLECFLIWLNLITRR